MGEVSKAHCPLRGRREWEKICDDGCELYLWEIGGAPYAGEPVKIVAIGLKE